MKQGIVKKLSENKRKAISLYGKMNGLGITGFIVIHNNENSKQATIINKSIPEKKDKLNSTVK